MKMGEARKGLRVCLKEPQKEPSRTWHPRNAGALTSGRILYGHAPYEEGLYVRVKWDAMPTPENWHLEYLSVLPDQKNLSRPT